MVINSSSQNKKLNSIENKKKEKNHSDEELLNLLLSEKIKLHELDSLSENADKIRLVYLEKKLNLSLDGISKSILSLEDCKGNIENLIGTCQIPLGISGPVLINGNYAKGFFYLPLATTEGALVASVNRGCKIINQSGGAKTIILSNEQTRSLLFKSNDIYELKEFSDWIEQNFETLKKIGEETSNHIEIKKIETYILGLNIWLRLKAFTNEAMGMNMITIAGKKIADYIIENYIKKEHKSIIFISESGNLCVDKKPSFMNLINTRGKKVIASININEKDINEILKTTSDKLIDINYRKNLLGSAFAGSLGFNAHFANIIAAMFLATGQDLAHVVDGSLGFTTIEKIENQNNKNKSTINISITIPSLQVGTIGGGTKLKTQKECLSILSCEGKNSSLKLAEIIAVAVLAGEISLLSALTTKELAEAHKKLNRK
ncbi:MAG: hydroxymethylglutaryl-CoA reductase [Candidatus Woesearchaeota archaeon]